MTPQSIAPGWGMFKSDGHVFILAVQVDLKIIDMGF